MVRIQTIRERTRGSPRPASQGEGVQRLLKTPRVFQRCTDVRHLKRNELRANLLPCILQTGDTADCTDETVERSEKYKYYKSSLGSRDTEADDRALSEWDPARQAAQACTHLRDLAEERCRLRPVEELVNTSSNLPFVHKDQDADLDELMNALTVEIQNLETRRGNQSFTSLQIASRVPLLVKDPDGISMETQCLPNDVHTLRLDLSPKEVRHIAYNMKSRHLKGSALERRLVAVVDPEHSTLASLVRSLRERETNAEGLVSVLNDLLREVAKELPTDLKSPALERMQTILAEPRRTLTRLLSVSDRLAALAQPLVASLAQAIDRMALICVREVDRLASFCHAEFEKLLSALYASEEARKSADEFVDRLSGRNVGKDMHSRLKNMENELHLQARSHAKLIEERNQLEAMLEEEAHAAAALRVKVKELEQEMKYRRQQAWKAGSSPRSPLRGHAKSDDSVDADDIDEGRSAASSVKQISPPLAFAVSESVQTETEFYFCKDDDLPEPAEMSFHQHADALWTVSRLFRLLCKYEWNDKTASFLHKSGEDLSSEEEPMPRRPSGPRRPSLLAGGGSGGSGDRAAEIRRLKGKVEAAHQQAATAQLKEQVACLQLLVKSNFDSWMSKMLQDAGSSHVSDKLPSPDKLFAAVMEVTQTGGLQRRIRELEDNLKRLIPMSDRLRQNEGGDSGFWKRIMRAVRHSMTARRGSSAMKGKAIQRANSSAKVVQINSLARLHGELALVWQAIPPKAAKLAAGTLLLRPMAPQALQEALKNFYLKSCGRHKQVENAIFNLCRAVLQFASSYKVLLFAVMSDIIPVGELNDRLPKVVNDISPYGPSLHVEYLGNLPFDAAQTMNEFMLALKNIRRSRQFVGSHDGSFEKIQMGGSETERRGPELEKEDALLPVPLILAAGHATICSRSKLTARCFNLLVLGYARRPKLLQNVEEMQRRLR
ncbi:unnamed protein product [Effrenium voratum]|nr:unnamed protein product [Effrenium voratum]